MGDGEEGLAPDALLDPNLVDFLIRIEGKLDRILQALAKHDLCDDDPVYNGEGLDISGSGMRLLSEENVEPGKILDARFRIIKYPLVLLQVFGKVVRVRPLESKGEQLYEIAVEFLDLKEDYKEWIISYVFQIQRETIRREKGDVNG
jgi:c-di-GMP-binding flagellar brake protein YcgR